MTALIRISKNTAAHEAYLQKLGYETEVVDLPVKVKGEEQMLPHLRVTVDGFIEGDDCPVDMSKPGWANVLTEGGKKRLFTYKTVFVCPDGRERTSIMACQYLGEHSALIAKPEVKAKKTSSKVVFDPFADLD